VELDWKLFKLPIKTTTGDFSIDENFLANAVISVEAGEAVAA